MNDRHSVASIFSTAPSNNEAQAACRYDAEMTCRSVENSRGIMASAISFTDVDTPSGGVAQMDVDASGSWNCTRGLFFVCGSHTQTHVNTRTLVCRSADQLTCRRRHSAHRFVSSIGTPTEDDAVAVNALDAKALDDDNAMCITVDAGVSQASSAAGLAFIFV